MAREEARGGEDAGKMPALLEEAADFGDDFRDTHEIPPAPPGWRGITWQGGI